MRTVLLKFTNRCAKPSWLFLAKSAAVLEFVSKKDSRNGIRLDFVLVFLCPLCVRHGKEVYSASKGIQDSLVNVFPVLFVINAIAVDELGSARETEVSASIGLPLVFKTSLQ